MKEIFVAIAAFFGFMTKAVPSDKIRETNQQVKLPRLEANERDKLLLRAFRELKRHPEQSIDVYVTYKFDSLDPEDQKELTQLLRERLTKFWNKHPHFAK